MQKSTNYGLNLPEKSDQYNLDDWNFNTNIIDSALKQETTDRQSGDNSLLQKINQEISDRQNAINDIIETHATKTETEKVKWLKSVKNGSNNTKYYVVKNIKKDPLQIMGSITRIDTICSVFNFTVTNNNKEQTRIVGMWNNSKMYGQTWEILPFRVYYQSDGTYNLWVEIPSYSSMKIVLSSYSGTDYNFQESAFDDTGIVCPNEMSITANKLSKTLTIAEGGTGATTSKGAQYQLLNDMKEEMINAKDDTLFVGAYAFDNITTGTVYKRKGSTVWEWIKSKISSVLGLTATQYNGNAKTAKQATGATPFNASEQIVTAGTVTRAIAQNVRKNENGWISRIALGLTNKLGQFSDGIISLGSNDAGTEWEDFTFKKGTGGEVITSATINNQTVNNAGFAYRSGTNTVYTCSTDAGTASKTVSVTEFTLTTGACIRVLFTNGNSVASPTLNVNNTGAKEIKSYNGKPLEFRYGSLSYGSYTWDSNTLLELYYNGTDWLCVNNPIVCNKEDEEKIGSVYLDGKKEQSGFFRGLSSAEDNSIRYHFNFDSLTYFLNVSCTQDNELGENRTMAFAKLKGITNNGFSCHTIRTFLSGDAVVKDDGNYCWLAIGY